ncbi:hypothetical protein ACFL9U_12775 [Thermodesulfobacteriota bacterium]
MKRAITCVLGCLIMILSFSVPAKSVETPIPFGFQIAKTSYTEALSILKSKEWDFREYTKKHFKEVDKKSPDKGKNTFLMVKTKKLEGINGIRLFFDKESSLDAIIIVMDPKMFPAVMDELNKKYKLVKKNLLGVDYSSDYTHVLWEIDTFYIELQRLSAHNVRLVYVTKLLYENYKDFMHKSYENFRIRSKKEDWMKEL